MTDVLIIAPEGDLHAEVVAERLRQSGDDALVWNTTWFPWRQSLSWSPGAGASLRGDRAEAVNLGGFSVIWWRRFCRPTLDPRITDPGVKRFCSTEALELLRGVFTTFPGRIVNDPDEERRAEVKPLQLKVAGSCGLMIPETLISNRRDDVLVFLERHPSAICKPFVCDYAHNVPVRSCTANDFVDESEVALAPVIVQELIEAKLDIRAMLIGDEVFAGELSRPDINERVDWRRIPTGWKAHTLPQGIAASLVCVARKLGLDLGSFDLRLSLSGEYVFLEVNPSGQFLFLEVEAGLPITSALAAFLARQRGSRHLSAKEARP
jgi:glutathione synthase/RimK-type ligase-like ATP-grasp enzyme